MNLFMKYSCCWYLEISTINILLHGNIMLIKPCFVKKPQNETVYIISKYMFWCSISVCWMQIKSRIWHRSTARVRPPPGRCRAATGPRPDGCSSTTTHKTVFIRKWKRFHFRALVKFYFISFLFAAETQCLTCSIATILYTYISIRWYIRSCVCTGFHTKKSTHFD